ncbi:AraC family transcriptional regulator [Insulibacter thermoxylanivorax]|uniref:AraC family transcriptional regulator n=1 Tax=Insulibacter thermoxylanivorax TaxID=2749268 RepID=A0A916VF61_9BACL|nr:AraC family transcriptional regulator [Insulibacter thermoxylanivorax]GFR37026.1 AraC family transcriptional regulator [Insulibacter thermoxylanivorax]
MAHKKIIHIERSRHDQRMDMMYSHFHDRYEIYYLLSGERFYFIDNQMYLVQAGDLVFIDQYALHQTRDTGISHHERILIEFAPEFLKPLQIETSDLLSELFIRGGQIIRLAAKERKEIESILFELVRESAKQQAFGELNIKMLLVHLLIRAARSNPKSLEQRDVFHPTLREIIGWISMNFRDPSLSLEQISEKFSISKYYLCRLFKQNTGYTFTSYVNLLRIREAQRLLRETDDKIMTICERSGFENVHHFCRVFKQISHVSPMQYRKEYQETLKEHPEHSSILK